MRGHPEQPQAGALDGRRAHRLVLGTLLAAAGFLNLHRLGRVGTSGFGNAYYAAGVKSMLMSRRNFIYLAFDPAGFLAMDKAPLALWLQAASAKFFGFHGLSLLVPQAIAGTLSVYVLYRLVRHSHGERAGLVAALSLAVMPISVVTNRTNFPDSLLILTLLLAAAAFVKAAETDTFGWLWAGAAMVGVAFNVKMLQIVLAAPAFGVVYLVGSQLPLRKRCRRAIGALAVFLAVAAPWVLAVELTPPDRRPYVGGSDTNSVLELIVDYNGAARLRGEDFSAFLGRPGPLRLANSQLAGQVSWLLPLALIAIVVGATGAARIASSDAEVRRRALFLWSTWLIPQAIFFSVSTFYHRYYMATMAPAIAALVGIAVDELVPRESMPVWRLGLAAGTLAVTAGLQALILSRDPAWGRWLIPLVVVLVGAAALAILLLSRRHTPAGWHGTRAAFIVGFAILLVAPTIWSAIPVFTCANTTLPVAGPQPHPCPSASRVFFLDPALAAYLEANRDGARFLAATYDLGIAELGILQTGEPWMALGGYRGTDPILTTEAFADLVAQGQVRYFLSLDVEDRRPQQQTQTLAWAKDHCPPTDFRSPGVLVSGPCITD